MLTLVCLHLYLATLTHRPAVHPRINPWLHVVSVAMAQADVGATIWIKQKYGSVDEHDPLARPFTRLPSPAYEAVSMAMIVGLNLLADRMNRSERFHKFARPLLMLQIAGSGQGFGYTLANRNNP